MKSQAENRVSPETPKPVKRNSCKALVVQDGQVLVIEKRDATGAYYVIPGGGQEWGEEMRDTVSRECLEEAGTRPVEIKRIVCVREYIGAKQDFPNANKALHQTEFYFECRVDRADVKEGTLPDARQTGIAWLDVADIHSARLYPAVIKDVIRRLADGRPLGDIYVGARD